MTQAASAPGRHRASDGRGTSRFGDDGPGRIDATTVLTAFFLFTMIVPAGQKVAALGSLGAPSTIMAVFVLVWWIWDHFHRYEAGQQQPQPVRRATVVLIVVSLVVHRHAMMQPMAPDEISPSDSAFVRFLALLGIVLVASDGITDIERLHVLVRRLTLAVGMVSTLALLQFLTGQLWVDRIAIPGLSPTATDGLLARGGFLRPTGTSTHPIEYGAVLGMMLPIVVTHARIARSGKALAWASVATTGLAILLSISRTALICSALAMLILLCTWPGRARLMGLLTGLGALAAASLVLPGLFGTLRGMFIGSAGDPSVLSRTAGYAYAEEMFSYNPWFGRGMGTFLPKYYILDNGYLGMLLEAGLIGVLAFAVLLGCALMSAFRAGRRFVRLEDRQVCWALLASVVAGSVSMAFFDLFAFPQSAACLALVVGLSGAAYRLAREPSPGTVTALLVPTPETTPADPQHLAAASG